MYNSPNIKVKTNTGSYMGIKFNIKTQQEIKNWCNEFKISNPVSGNNLHTTIMYSRKYVDVKSTKYMLSIDPKTYSLDIFGNNILVLKYKSLFLKNKWKDLIKLGATYDFDEYKIHMTLSYKFYGDIKKLKIPTFPLILEEEYVEELKDINIIKDM